LYTTLFFFINIFSSFLLFSTSFSY